ncbi:4-hydroxybenzoate 3-monooxygenase [Actinokineospora diospyrosa]|uniref:p-hydroxybenzoate 3-monooxygenase n=1 Tax=Actinokineospora diospyrosa TaxID=103728 RepID=A0ABT1IFT6_9PSEU|nr:4-hydroxybenzoate 3-monooxygenase [Actinokineospora diospyrosa]MCP2271511.1 p-hydroxybenzoate 3-monooxygenase [Actinokineospora diospyrosa]
MLVGIIGAGPAGLLLGRLLHRAGIDAVVFESRDRAHVEQRQRAGILEQATVDALRTAGAADRLEREGIAHDGIDLVFDGTAHRVDFLGTTGARVWIYAQTEVVKDLIALRIADGLPLLFDTPVTAVSDLDGRPTIHYGDQTLTCDYIVGCDGFHGITRPLVPGTGYELSFPHSWLGILADAPPMHHELVYAHSRRGFALASMRSPSVSRMYLQVDNGEDPAAWPDDRIWSELARRFGDHQPNRGPITAKSVLPMRAWVAPTLRHGNLFLAGDAGHIVPPTGAKGLNLAVADVVLLAASLAERHRTGSADLLDAYSDSCLRRVWRAEQFSHFMTTTLHVVPGQSEFDTQLQVARLRGIVSSRAAATSLAEEYTGITPAS